MRSMLSRLIELSSGQQITCADPKTQLEYAETELCCSLRPFGQRREGFLVEKNTGVPLLRSPSEKQCLRTGSRTPPTHRLSEDGQTVARPNRFSLSFSKKNPSRRGLSGIRSGEIHWHVSNLRRLFMLRSLAIHSGQ